MTENPTNSANSSSSTFQDVESLYEDLGEKQALRAVMTYPEYRDDQNADRFFDSGEKEIAAHILKLKNLSIDVNKGKCLDFGCGVGRLTNALALYFEQVIGVNLSSTMISKAEEIQKQSNAHFLLNKRDDLQQIESETLDFIYSNKTFQHIPYPASKNYIQDFFRVLKPRGVAVFLVHKYKHHDEDTISFKCLKWYREKVRPFFKKLRGKPPVQIHSISKKNIGKFVTQAGGEIIYWEVDTSYTKRQSGNLRTWYWAGKKSDTGADNKSTPNPDFRLPFNPAHCVLIFQTKLRPDFHKQPKVVLLFALEFLLNFLGVLTKLWCLSLQLRRCSAQSWQGCMSRN